MDCSAWCGADPLSAQYRDSEWGVLVHDGRILFKMLCLEGAQAALELQSEHGTLDGFLSAYVDRRPRQNTWRMAQEAPARTKTPDRMSCDLGKLGFKFVGSTICYAFMQAVGMVNDHTIDSFRHREPGGVAGI